jgi:hypothetical protein
LYLHLQDARAKERVQDLEAQLVRERARAAGLQRESEWKIGALQQEVAEKDKLIATMTASYSQLSLGDQNQLIVDALGKGIVDLTALDQRVAILLRTAAGQSEPDISFEVAARQLEKALSDRKTILKVNVVQPGIDGLRKLADARSRKQAATR